MNSNLSLSFELICLMGWLLEKDKEKLEALVRDALAQGLADRLETMQSIEYFQITEQMHKTVHDFVDFLEQALVQAIEGIGGEEKTTREKLAPAVKKIDVHAIDLKTVWLSMQQAKTGLIKRGASKTGAVVDESDAQKVLFEKLLKNWKPSHNEPMN